MADDVTVSADERVYVCIVEDCWKQFKRKDRLIIHSRTHTGERPFKCDEPGCNKSYCRQPHLLRHQQNAHKQTPETDKVYFKCTAEGCNSVFTLRQNMKKHFQRQHSTDNIHLYKCEVEGCDATFRKHHQLRTHNIAHTNINPFQCTECSRTFQTSARLQRHLKVHRGYKCEEEGCGLTFGKWTDLQAHKTKTHLENHQCEVCGKVFPQGHRLNAHIRSHQARLTPLACPHDGCDRKYWDKRNLKAHLLSYHEKQRFPCTVADCGKTFASKQKLKGHHAVHEQAAGTKKGKKRRKPTKTQLES